MSIYLTAIVKSTPGNASAMKDLLQQLVIASTKETACLQYELYQSAEDENLFIFHETWANQHGLDLHNQQPHLQSFGKQGADIMDGPVIIHKADRVS